MNANSNTVFIFLDIFIVQNTGMMTQNGLKIEIIFPLPPTVTFRFYHYIMQKLEKCVVYHCITIPFIYNHWYTKGESRIGIINEIH